MTSSLKFAELGEEYYSRIKTQKLENTHLIHVNKDLKAKLELNLSEEELLEVCTKRSSNPCKQGFKRKS